MSGQERVLDLLTSRATEGLSVDDSRELEAALREQADFDADGFDLAAAAVDLAFEAISSDHEPMPEHLKQKILAQGETHLSSHETGRPEASPLSVTPFRKPESSATSPFDTRYLGWYAAAAMLLLLILGTWAPWSRTPTSGPSLAELRSEMLANAPDVIQVQWAPPEIEGYTQVQGDVVWSNRQQDGFMRLGRLPANRGEVEQYQLWIVDPSRDERPIDGGVFDIPAGADEVIVRIDAKLRVDDPKVFAITLEQAGGVVVSDGPLLVVAPVDA